MKLLLIAAEALVMLFELRFLLQSASADYYHPFTQAVLKLTNPLVNLPALRSLHIKSWYIGGAVVGFIISFAFWLILGTYINLPLQFSLTVGALMPFKVFGYLLFMLLIIQALTSWLPSTRSLSCLMYQITAPITAPVQRIIPPIGMIDISLMVIILVLYAVNSLCYRVFGIFWAVI